MSALVSVGDWPAVVELRHYGKPDQDGSVVGGVWLRDLRRALLVGAQESGRLGKPETHRLPAKSRACPGGLIWGWAAAVTTG